MQVNYSWNIGTDFETGEGINSHSQELDLAEGTYKIYFKCTDAGGNTDYSETTFSVYVDKFSPNIVRTYGVNEKIKVLTDEDSTCKYSTDSCNFDLSKGEGTNTLGDSTKEHWLEWKLGQNYYLKCLDSFNNQPDPTECTITLKAFELPQEIL